MNGETKTNNVDVSVILVSYNHGNYIAEAIDSILKQDVNFTYEVVFADDVSKDNTREIIKEHGSKFENVQYLFREDNVGCAKNVVEAVSKCKGRYIAYLEGDDYWYDKNKLQMQYDFLENNPDYVGVGAKRALLGRRGNILTAFPKRLKSECDVTVDDYLNQNFPTITETMYRNIYETHLRQPEQEGLLYLDRMILLDTTFNILLLRAGKIRFLPFISGMYRTDIAGNTTNFNASNKIFNIARNHILVYSKLDEYFNYQYDYKKIYADHLFQCSIFSYLSREHRKEYKALKKTLKKEHITYFHRHYVFFFIKYGLHFFVKIIRSIR